MIVPEGMKLKLDPNDDFTHSPEPMSNYNESMYFNAFDKEQPVGLWVRLGNRPNEGHAEMTVCVYLPDKSVGFFYKRAPITNNDQMSAGGLTFRVIEAFKKHEITYEGDILLMKDPSEMYDPGKAFKSNPTVPARIKLDISGVSQVHGGEIVNADGSKWDLDPEKEVFRGHIEQHTAARGTIQIGEQIYEIDGPGYRDKSWGPRHWQSFYHYKWAPITFGPDFGAMLAYMGRPDDTPVIVGHIFEDGKLTPIRDATIRAEYDDRYYQEKITISLITENETYDIEAETYSLIPLRHRRRLQDGTLSTARITEGMVRYRCRGHEVWGMSEFLDLILENGVPISVELDAA